MVIINRQTDGRTMSRIVDVASGDHSHLLFVCCVRQGLINPFFGLAVPVCADRKGD